MKLIRLTSVFIVLFSFKSQSLEIYEDFPDEIHPYEKYVIYSHNMVIEGKDPRPVHPRFGVADFPAVKQAIFQGGDFNLIAHHRPKNTKVESYAEMLEKQVRKLVSTGVDASHITLIGFSKGGRITAIASSKLNDLQINTVIMASCYQGDVSHEPPLVLSGNLLSMYETSDMAASCQKLVERSHLKSFKEISLSTGKEHGAFFIPREEWLQPLKSWMKENGQ